MPLKHDAETALVLVLGFMIALAGAVAAFLPPLSVSVLPWAIAFAVAIIYPLALYPMMKENRADHEFRALHFVPALVLFVWMLLDLLVAFRPEWQMLQTVYTWGWGLAVVIAAFVLLVMFCLRVIRQRFPRIALLLAVLIPFVILSQLSEKQDWDRKLAMSIWNGNLTGTGLIASGGNSSNLDPSTDSVEEQWRAQLRQMERRRQQLEQEQRNGSSSSVIAVASSSSIVGAKSSAIIAVVTSTPRASAVASSKTPSNSATSSKKAVAAASVSSKTPPRLPSSGFGMETVLVTMMAGCSAAIHRKTMLRAKRLSSIDHC